MKKALTLLLFIVVSPFVRAQEGNEPVPDVAFAVIEKVPVYPGCSGEDNESLKKCMSDNISKFVATEFNVKKASRGLDAGIHRVYVSFLINSKGKVTKVRSRGPNAALEKEAIRVVEKLPQMEAGEQKGQKVGVLYSLPITFNLEKDKEDKKKKRN